jgi:hypothetical protein
MKFYQTQNFLAVFFLVGLSGLLGILMIPSNSQETVAVQAQATEVHKLNSPLAIADEASVPDAASLETENETPADLLEMNQNLEAEAVGGELPITISPDDSESSSNFASSVDVDTNSNHSSTDGHSLDSPNSSDSSASSSLLSSSDNLNGGVSGAGVSGGGASGTGGGGSGSSGSGTSSITGSGKSGQPVSQENKPDAPKTILSELMALQPLPKVHYYWPIEADTLVNSENESLLYQVARLTHSVCFRGEKASLTVVKNAVYLCAKVNKTDPSIPCSIGVNFSPWHSWYPGLFPADLPPTYRGEEYKAELALFASRLKQIKAWVSEYNLFYGSSIEVGAILLDCERFEVKKDNPAWNNGIQEILNITHETVMQVFPKARIEWYGRGIRGNQITPYWTQKEHTDSLSCSLYTLPKPEDMEMTFKRTCGLADELNIEPVTPWVALGSGYQYGTGIAIHWVWNWPYNPTYAHEAGCKLNSLSDSWYKRAQIIVFYPEPFHTNSTNWGQHFVEYCKGAAEANPPSDE